MKLIKQHVETKELSVIESTQEPHAEKLSEFFEKSVAYSFILHPLNETEIQRQSVIAYLQSITSNFRDILTQNFWDKIFDVDVVDCSDEKFLEIIAQNCSIEIEDHVYSMTAEILAAEIKKAKQEIEKVKRESKQEIAKPKREAPTIELKAVQPRHQPKPDAVASLQTTEAKRAEAKTSSPLKGRGFFEVVASFCCGGEQDEPDLTSYQQLKG